MTSAAPNVGQKSNDGFILVAVLWILGGLALVLSTRKRLPGASLAALLVGFWIAFHVTLIHGEPRYMLSVTPLVAPALAWLLVAATRQVMAIAGRVRAGAPQ